MCPLEHYSYSSVGRVDFIESLSKDEILLLCLDKDVKVLQSVKPVEINTWKLINEHLLPKRPDIEIRIYGHYSQECNLSFLACLPNVRRLAIDSLMDAQGIEVVRTLKHLDSLHVGIYSLDNFNFLNEISETITELILGETKSKKPSLKPLERFKSLKTLYIDGQQKGIESIGALQNLEVLSLGSVSLKDISFIRELRKMWSLVIILGGIKDLSALESLSNIKYLELNEIRGLDDISVISSLTGLQYLSLQALRNVKSIPDMSKLHKLRRIYLETMKGLIDVSGLFTAPALEEFWHVSAENIKPEQYFGLPNIRSLRKARVGFGSAKKNTDFDKIMKQNNIDVDDLAPFEYKT